MKEKRLLLYIVIPIVFGYLTNLIVLVPGLGMLIYYVMPYILLIYWFWVGIQFSKSSLQTLPALVYGNGLSILSLVLYYWQFVLISDEARNIVIAVISQMYSAPLSPITARFGILFEKVPNAMTQTSVTAMYVIGTVLLVITFVAGYVFGRLKYRRHVELD